MKDFADTLELYFDGFEAAVISKDKKKEYVSLWYKEKWTDSKGVTDSIFAWLM